eukprot:PhM_4_TR15069/c0_g2_i1/m.509
MCDLCRPRPYSAMRTAEWRKITPGALTSLLDRNYSKQVNKIRVQNAAYEEDVLTAAHKTRDRALAVKPHPSVDTRLCEESLDRKIVLRSRLEARFLTSPLRRPASAIPNQTNSSQVVVSPLPKEQVEEAVDRLYRLGMRDKSAVRYNAVLKQRSKECIIPKRLGKEEMVHAVDKLYTASIGRHRDAIAKAQKEYTFVRGRGAKKNTVRTLHEEDKAAVVDRLFKVKANSPAATKA